MLPNVVRKNFYRRWFVRDASGVASSAFVVAVLAATLPLQKVEIAIYALSFWHYVIYALGFCFAAVPLRIFRRDAIIMKSVALAALMAVYLPNLSNFTSLAIVAIGFLLNAAGAAALGFDRTYYGREIAGLPAKRITAFPYSVVRHPMLIGNLLAFGAMLLDPAFLRNWWPLGAMHVALNIGLLLFEIAVDLPKLRRRLIKVDRYAARHAFVIGEGPLISIGWVSAGLLSLLLANGLIAVSAFVWGSIGVYASILYCCYRAPELGGANHFEPVETKG